MKTLHPKNLMVSFSLFGMLSCQPRADNSDPRAKDYKLCDTNTVAAQIPAGTLQKAPLVSNKSAIVTAFTTPTSQAQPTQPLQRAPIKC